MSAVSTSPVIERGTTTSRIAAIAVAVIIALLAVAPQFLSTGAELVPEALQNSKGFGDYSKAEFERTRQAAAAAGLTPQ